MTTLPSQSKNSLLLSCRETVDNLFYAGKICAKNLADARRQAHTFYGSIVHRNANKKLAHSLEKLMMCRGLTEQPWCISDRIMAERDATRAIEEGAQIHISPNVKDQDDLPYRSTVLTMALCVGSFDLVKLLLERGADPAEADVMAVWAQQLLAYAHMLTEQPNNTIVWQGRSDMLDIGRLLITYPQSLVHPCQGMVGDDWLSWEAYPFGALCLINSDLAAEGFEILLDAGADMQKMNDTFDQNRGQHLIGMKHLCQQIAASKSDKKLLQAVLDHTTPRMTQMRKM